LILVLTTNDQRPTTNDGFMTWIKICGITNLEDALVAVDAGADALGFVFYEKSPRNISPDEAREIIAELPEQVERVGVYVADIPFGTVKSVGLTALQRHVGISSNSADPKKSERLTAYSSSKPLKLFLSFPMRFFFDGEEQNTELLAQLSQIGRQSSQNRVIAKGFFDTLFLDSGTPNKPGGTGNPFDWKKALPIVEEMHHAGWKLVVAGGLTPENVSEAMGILHPWGVDVSSGVEARPGKKDPEKVRAFIKAVREADKANSN
jgi:phosphoribosylanthranilate isomerase